jgi:broad specificity phosphatase PhoE
MNNKGLYAETEAEVTNRFCNWFNKIIKNSKDEKIAVFLHAKILIMYLKTLGYELKFTEDGYWIKKGGKIICDKKVIGNPLLVKLEFANGQFVNFENIALDFALTKHPLWW